LSSRSLTVTARFSSRRPRPVDSGPRASRARDEPPVHGSSDRRYSTEPWPSGSGNSNEAPTAREQPTSVRLRLRAASQPRRLPVPGDRHGSVSHTLVREWFLESDEIAGAAY